MNRQIRAIHVTRNWMDEASLKSTFIGYGFSVLTLATIAISHLG